MGATVSALVLLCLCVAVNQVMSLLRNISEARRSGFRAMIIHQPYYNRHLWRDWLGDAFIIVSPGLMVMHVSNAELNHWIMSQRERFPKWTPAYKVLAVFGPNLVVTEGHEWRRHRRLASGAFTESNTALVFQESVRQSLSMLRKWTGDSQGVAGTAQEKRAGGKMLLSVHEDATKLTLHIISYVGFGLRMLWPCETQPEDTDATLTKFSSLTAPEGYQVAFLDAIGGVLHHIIYVVIFPIWLLGWMPLASARQAGREARDYLKYSNELLEKRLLEDKQAGGEMKSLGMDFLGHLVRTGNDGTALDREAIIGNSFILQLAGHETTANALFFTIVFLACFPEAQRRLQQDLDEVLGDTEPSAWEYAKVVPALLASNVGAAMYETLRLLPPTVILPKMAAQDEAVTLDGKQYTIPAGMPVFLGILDTARDARYWPTRPSRYATGKTDIEDYLPERWFRKSKQEGQGGAKSSVADKDEEASYDNIAGPTMSEKLFRPVAGAYVPFSDGARSCIGRRIAQTELMATLAVLFRGHSIELAVDDGGEVEDMADVRERSAERALYLEARCVALEALKTARTTTTLKLADGQQIGLRIARRGEERFVRWMD
ncbi:Cytochrome P450 [Cordyceps fumosorosea ARSEF 2679]|uniref:Cytochrome P450 n=1 Tax=Cordyceps fumosorosea (strain ARSEF 2679) TaxID=1081104 RepID=A0A162MVY3_CORFA|nr:Cytochrome P450 [Cordyceps fumosorosea ARSEF 2679]OAA71439.1 Cytochrome P450 [Cordyceps fumosorosea ARSEF 2679]